MTTQLRSLPLLYKRDFIGVFTIRVEKTSWLWSGRQVCYSYGTVDNIIDSSMAVVSAFAPSAAEAMGGGAINLACSLFYISFYHCIIMNYINAYIYIYIYPVTMATVG